MIMRSILLLLSKAFLKTNRELLNAKKTTFAVLRTTKNTKFLLILNYIFLKCK